MCCGNYKVRDRLNLENACSHSLQNVFTFCLLPNNQETEIYKTTVLSIALYGCENWSLTLREEFKVRMFENRVFRNCLDLNERK
jgi:hypothetical protein